jgi:hypothetical protein
LFCTNSCYSLQSTRLHGIHRPRNASIDVVTPSDLQNVQARPLETPRSEKGSPLLNPNVTSQTQPNSTNAPSNPYSVSRVRQPSLATTDEQDETEPNRVAGRPRSTSSQSVSAPYGRSTIRPGLQTQPGAASLQGGYTSPSYNPQHTSVFFGNQQQQQDWASLSFEDLVALQILLVHPSPLSRLRHPKPSIPFEAALATQLFTLSTGRPPSFSTESAWDYRTGGTQFLAVVHRALWVLENAALATVADSNINEASFNDASIVSAPSAISIRSQGSSSTQSSPPLEGRDHLAPAMACVIGIVRSVLSTSECLARDSVNLQKFPVLLGHRKVSYLISIHSATPY